MIRDRMAKKTDAERDRMESLWRSLSARDRQWLRQRLQRRMSPAQAEQEPRLSPDECRAAEEWFRQRSQTARSPAERLARMRLWCIFMLLRYGGLRLVEVFALRDKDLDWEQACVRISGRQARNVPLPSHVVRSLRAMLADPRNLGGPLQLRCDASLVRRTLSRCAGECGLPPGLLSARQLRLCRAQELLRQGLPAPLLDVFLGRNHGTEDPAALRYAPRTARQLLHEYVTEEEKSGLKSSARNRLCGRVTSCQSHGLACTVDLLTSGGLALRAIITEDSRQRLRIQPGQRLMAHIKSPFIHLAGDGVEPPPDATHFRARITQIRQDAHWREVLLRLSDGTQLCVLQQDSHQPRLAPDNDINAWFSPLCVILLQE